MESPTPREVQIHAAVRRAVKAAVVPGVVGDDGEAYPVIDAIAHVADEDTVAIGIQVAEDIANAVVVFLRNA